MTTPPKIPQAAVDNLAKALRGQKRSFEELQTRPLDKLLRNSIKQNLRGIFSTEDLHLQIALVQNMASLVKLWEQHLKLKLPSTKDPQEI